MIEKRVGRSLWRTVDWSIVACWLALVVIGWLSIHSSVNSLGDGVLSLSSRSGKQFLWICISIALGATVLFVVRPKLWEVLSVPGYGVVLALLLAVIVFGTTVNGSKSWFSLGPVSFQPSELSKITTSLLLAHWLHVLRMNRSRDVLMIVAVMLVPMAVILAEGETGTLLVYMGYMFVLYREGLSGWWVALAFTAVVLFVLTLTAPGWVPFAVLGVAVVLFVLDSGVGRGVTYSHRVRTWIMAAAAAVAGVAMIFSTTYVFEHVLKPHQKQRIEVLLGMKEDLQGAGYNVNQSMIAIGSGGLTGKGYLHGTQTAYGFVPEQSTDFIFCTIGEEAGFLGCLAVISLFCFLIIKIILDAEGSREAFTRIYGYCVASILFMHMVINVGMTVGLMPVIGIPLPFISYGGSSLMAFTLMLFIFLALVKEEKKYF